MSSTLYRLGQWSFVHRRRVATIWLLVLLVVGAGAATLSKGTSNEFTIPGTESTTALAQLSHTFPQVSGSSARLIVVTPDGVSVESDAVRTPVEAFVATAEKIGSVAAVADPYGDSVSGTISSDEQAVMVSVQLDGQSTTIPQSTSDDLVAAKDTLAAALPTGSEVALGGDLFTISVPTVSATEAFGVLVALIVLLFTFGSVLAAGMPLLNALLGVAITMAGIYAATRFSTISSTTPLLALMLGLAVGIDYALFIVSRHQGQLRSGMDPRESTARSLATAGSAVVFAGLTVMIALVGLAVARIPFLTIMGVAAAAGVGIAVLVALTLTPALLGFAGDRIRPGRRAQRRAERRRAADPSAAPAPRATATPSADGDDVHPNRFFSGWVRASTRWPLATILIIVIGLGALALPARDLRLALPDAGTQPAGSAARVTYDLVAEHFGPGYNGPLMVTGSIVGSTDPLTLMADLKTEIEALPGVAAVPLSTPNADATMGVIQVIPTGAPDSQETSDLVHAIRAQHDHFLATYGVDLSVTGLTAVQIDISAKLGTALLPFGIFVVGLSFLLLMMVFRSLWVPLKATAGYLLSIVASFGVVSLVFEHGIGASLLGVDKTPQAVLSFMPIVVMGVLFGLAMDYEVFLVS
ncbi:MAG: MMPL family transporter, partial [Cellulomonas sp.]|nr:MMPL family transporter [Cellulomonas sp.]